MMRHSKEAVMGPDKWAEVNKMVTKEDAKSIFNFKEKPKRKMLKVNISSILIYLSICMIGSLQCMESCHGMMKFHNILQNYFM